MLELKEYTREELIAIYKTTRLDAIKNKVTREGYKYTSCGRGKDYKMVITLLPNKNNAFKEYCIKNLGFAAQTDFLKLKVFINAILSNDDLIKLHTWLKRSQEFNFKGKKKKSYKGYIQTWFKRDPLKRQTARENNLNWLEFFNMQEFMNWYSNL